jgi:uncharacterized membrane protein
MGGSIERFDYVGLWAVVCVAVWVSAALVCVVLEGSLLFIIVSYLCFLIELRSHYREK